MILNDSIAPIITAALEFAQTNPPEERFNAYSTKLAELLISRCAEIAYQAQFCSENADIPSNSSSAIREYFFLMDDKT